MITLQRLLIVYKITSLDSLQDFILLTFSDRLWTKKVILVLIIIKAMQQAYDPYI